MAQKQGTERIQNTPPVPLSGLVFQKLSLFPGFILRCFEPYLMFSFAASKVDDLDVSRATLVSESSGVVAVTWCDFPRFDLCRFVASAARTA